MIEYRICSSKSPEVILISREFAGKSCKKDYLLEKKIENFRNLVWLLFCVNTNNTYKRVLRHSFQHDIR